jgi:hypothetical protein
MERLKKVRKWILNKRQNHDIWFYLVDLKVPQSSSKRAYAFIQYENMDMAYEARRAMDGHFIGKADCKIGYGM